MSVFAENPVPDDYDRTPGRAILILADDADSRARLAASAGAAGRRIVAQAPFDGATALIAARAGTTALVLDIARDGGADLDRLLDRIDEAARAARLDVLAIAPAGLIDVVSARLRDPGVTLLIDPATPELATALALLVAPGADGVAEPGGDDRRRLAELSRETARIARALASLSEGGEPARDDGVVDPATVLAATRGLIRTRRVREQFFDRALFADPAWDMLLDLFAARIERRQVAVSSLCIAAAVPPTTALRWIATMTARGLIERRPDPGDGRRMFLVLGERAADAMAGYVAAMLRHLVPAASATPGAGSGP